MSTNRDWKALGETDPFYGVLTHDEFRKGNITPEARDKFYRSGEDDVATHLREIEKAVRLGNVQHVVELGAGVGRLTIPFAKRFKRVSAIDISDGMLAQLRSRAAETGVSNITCYTSAAAISEKADLVVSRIVLQHIPVRQGMEIILELWSKLGEGGILALQVPFRSKFTRPMKVIRWLRDRLPVLQVPVNLIRHQPVSQAGLQMNVYPLNEVVSRLFDQGADVVHLVRAEKEPDHMHQGGLIVAVRGELS